MAWLISHLYSHMKIGTFPKENHVYFCECAANSGMEWGGAQLDGAQYTRSMIHNMEYTGVTLRTLLNEAGLDAAGDLSDKWVYVEGHDASSNGRSIPMEKALDDCIVAFKANGEAKNGTRVSCSPSSTRLGRQHVGEMVAPN